MQVAKVRAQGRQVLEQPPAVSDRADEARSLGMELVVGGNNGASGCVLSAIGACFSSGVATAG